METLSEAIERMAGEGYDDEFQVEGAGLRARVAGRWVRPEDLVCVAVARFEGASDPADETILFALRTREGDVRGTFATHFGVDVGPATAEVLHRLPPCEPTGFGEAPPRERT